MSDDVLAQALLPFYSTKRHGTGLGLALTRDIIEFAEVEASGRVRILIWERGVGPTSSSGTGTCASAVAAAQFGGAARTVEVAAPGGTQLVEWLDDGVYLTGWADVVMEGQWIADPA